MKDYMKINQDILNAWQKDFTDNGGEDCHFSNDGIMFRGELYTEEIEGQLQWKHKIGNNENELWENAKPRILYLTKDQNAKNGSAWDDRATSFRQPDSKKEDNKIWGKYRFHQNLVNTLYGLVNTTPDKFVEFEDIDQEEALKLSDSYPFARINCKKEAGGSNCSNDILTNDMENHSSYLEKQILNLEADILICCGHQNDENVILDFLNNHGYDFKWDEGDKGADDIYYDSAKNAIAIDVFHPSYYSKSEKFYYEDIVKTYYNFLKGHPKFIESLR
ncbi:MAG: hypothetical protein LKI59_09480 [Bacteroidales bacterium]|jgi:hypothetical protein|nr:hypothetical protein [Bacteroidales bacterium]